MPYTFEELAENGAEPTLRYLLNAIANQEPVTYGDLKLFLDQELPAYSPINVHHVGHPIGRLGYDIEDLDERIPPISAMVVMKPNIASYGASEFFARYLDGDRKAYKNLSRSEQRRITERAQAEVFAFPGWAYVYAQLFDQEAPEIEKPPIDEPDGKGMRAGLGGPAESEAHYNLKMYVLENPDEFGAPENLISSQEEFRLESGDEADVYFLGGRAALLVEVKPSASGDGDLKRGIYQCVKYREVLKAQFKIANKRTTVNVLLVTERPLPKPLRDQAAALDIPTQIAHVKSK